MDCNDAQRLIPAYFDGELDLIRSVEVEGHLQDCGECGRQVEAQRALRETVRSGTLVHAAPVGLERRMMAAVQRESRAANAWPAPARNRLTLYAAPAWATIAVAAVALLIWLQASWSTTRLPPAIADEAVTDHIRSLQAAHLYDVASTNQHTVKPWFTGKLDFSPPVVDLAGQGYPLAGGRLDYLEGHPVAALVYHKRLHVINLFVWPAAGAVSAPIVKDRLGYHVLQWAKGGMAYCAVSDVNAEDLREFSVLIVRKSGGP